MQCRVMEHWDIVALFPGLHPSFNCHLPCAKISSGVEPGNEARDVGCVMFYYGLHVRMQGLFHGMGLVFKYVHRSTS